MPSATATNMAEAGLPLDALQRLLGHRHLESVLVYNRVRDGRLYREYQETMARRAGRAPGWTSPEEVAE